MIVKMTKVTVVCLEKDRDSTLDALRELGVLHLVPREIEAESHAVGDARAQLERTAVALRMLSAHADAHRKSAAGGSAQREETPANKVVDHVHELFARRESMAERLAAIAAEKADIEPFGQFDQDQIKDLAAQGIVVKLYHTSSKKPFVPPAGVDMLLARKDASGQYLALFGPADFAAAASEIPLPARPLADMLAAETAARDELSALDQELTDVAASASQRLNNLLVSGRNELRFNEARDCMGLSGQLIYLRGFCPADRVANLQTRASEAGWGLLAEEPSADDQIPTLIRNPTWVRPIEALIKLIDVFPGYREADISVIFLLAFSIFFAIIVGDAGYGLVFLILTGIMRAVFKKAPPEPFRLLTILSLCTIAWGVISGNYFGTLPSAAETLTTKWLKNETNFMSLCFLMGAIHLSIGHLWQLVRTINSTRALAQVGWICLTWAMYFAANHLVLNLDLPAWFAYLLVPGLLLVTIFMTPLSRLKTEWSAHIMLPFGVINNFVDVVSYVRLFAVGGASLAVAAAFNEIALGSGVDSWLAGLMAAVILFFGHTLNIMLAIMSVLVHGIRLNTLEFSNHVGLEWSGFAYNPFALESNDEPTDDDRAN
jgi:V/A-type H+-transporting ATPase subunit I